METVDKKIDGPGMRTAINLLNEESRKRGENYHAAAKYLEDLLKSAKPSLERTGEPADDTTIATRAAHLLDQLTETARTKGPHDKVDISNFRHAMSSLRAALEGAWVPFRKPNLETETSKSSWRHGVETEERHESFGIISATRKTGGTTLFGSELTTHPHHVEIHIMRAVQSHDGVSGEHRYRPYYGADESGHPHVATIKLSVAQFAEMITNMNVGEGVPCTLATVCGIDMTPMPWTESAFNKAYHAALKHVSEAKDEQKIQAMLREAGEILTHKTLTKADRERLAKLMQDLGDGGASLAAWTGLQLQQARDKTLSVMKQEIASLASTMLTQLGLKALADDPSNLFRLTSGHDTKEENK